MPTRRELIATFDRLRAERGQPTISELDGAERFSVATHTRGDIASPLIFTASYADFLAIDRSRFDIAAVTGNSMGWYTALACAGAVGAEHGFAIVDAMGENSQAGEPGGQVLLTLVDEDWREVPGLRERAAGAGRSDRCRGRATPPRLDRARRNDRLRRQRAGPRGPARRGAADARAASRCGWSITAPSTRR